MGTVARKLVVDSVSGDVATIDAGITVASAAGVSPTSQWILELGLGTFTPASGNTYTLPAGLSIEGQGTHRSNIAAQVIVNPAGTLRNLRVIPPNNSVEFGVRCVLDSAYSNYSIQLHGINVTVSHTALLGILSGVEITGASTGSFVYIMPGCYFYVQNRYTAVNTGNAAKGVVFRMKSDVRTYVEGWGIHAKTSGGVSGTAEQILRLIECNPTPSVDDFGYIELRDTGWNNVYGGTGTQSEGYLMQSVNDNWPGHAASDVTYWSRGGGTPLLSGSNPLTVSTVTHRIPR